MKKETIAILGAGSWGTAVALHLAQAGHRILLWGHNPEHIQVMSTQRVNPYYLPNNPFPDNVIPHSDLEYCTTNAKYVIIAVPSHAFKETLDKIPQSTPGLTWITKGVDPETHQLLSVLVAKRFGSNYPMAVISGPSFAKEVAQYFPTALTLAGDDLAYQKQIHTLFHHHNVRVYLSDDLIGVQFCGAVKNVLAIACGISDGLGYGANAKAALITRGLSEMSRLGVKLGAKSDTFLGLAGVGDLVLTCTDDQSRNRRFGLLLGQGKTIEEAEKIIDQVVEGWYNSSQVCAISDENQVEMPICKQVNDVLKGKITPKQAVSNLMNRPAREE